MVLGMMILDSYWWLMLPGMILAIYAQIKLTSNYNRYLQVESMRGLSGADAARKILDHAGLEDMPVNEVAGHLTDHYDPTQRALFLSSENFHGTSLAAIGVAAHEAGHALQHKAAYAFLHLRMMLVPVTQFASTAAFGIMILSMFLHYSRLAWLAILIFGIITAFQLITLPVEFDASKRAKEQLYRLGLIHEGERIGVSKVLNAAAMTYVAAMVSAAMEMLHWVLIANSSDRD